MTSSPFFPAVPIRASLPPIVAGVPFTPEVFYEEEGDYFPICGHYFWDNNYGATMACRSLGFDIGVLYHTFAVYEKAAMPVGNCVPDFDLDLAHCTGGGNLWGNLPGYYDGYCGPGNAIGIDITCSDAGGYGV